MSFNHNLNHALLPLLNQLECIFCLLEGVPVAHQPLHINLSAGYQVYRRGVATGTISNGTTDSQIADTGSCDREQNIL